MSGDAGRILSADERRPDQRRSTESLSLESPGGVGTTRALARYACQTRWNDLSQQVRREAVRAFVNWFGCALGGCRDDAVERAMAGLARSPGRPAARLIGRDERLGLAEAALINCMSSAAYAFDDTHLATITHPTGPVAAAALALAEESRIGGEEFLNALALGMEIECRLSAALLVPGSGASEGWYITGVTGGIGAAAAAARLLGLDEDSMVSAIGIAATQACGLRATHASMTSPLVPGLAARNGLTAALLAAGGVTCGDGALEGRNGLFDVLAPNVDRTAPASRLGAHFEMLDNAYKPYPCGIVIHPAIDACLQIAREARPAPEAVTAIDLHVHRLAEALCSRADPRTAADAQVSIQHWAAASIVHRRAGLEQAGAACVNDERVRALARLVSVTVDPSLERDQAHATVTLATGERLTAAVEHALGSRDRPMNDEELDHKFLAQAAPLTGQARAEALLRIVRSVSSLSNVSLVLDSGPEG